MLSKNKRIPRQMFSLLLGGAKIFKNSLFLLRFISVKDLPNSRFGFSVSKKVSKSAVVRNRLRRLGYRLIEKYIPLIKSSVLVSFSFRNIPKNDENVAKNLESILKESHLIN